MEFATLPSPLPMSETLQGDILLPQPDHKPNPKTSQHSSAPSPATVKPVVSPTTPGRGPGSPIRRSSRSKRPRDLPDFEVDGMDAGPSKPTPTKTKPAEFRAAPSSQYIQPDHFYPLNNHQTNMDASIDPITGWAYGTEGMLLSPVDDKSAERGIPVFRPTMEEFKDFEGYVTKTVPWGQYSGIAKIIPPAEWVESCPPISKARLAGHPIVSPIQQNQLGKAGLFRQTNVEKRKTRPFSIKEWYEMCCSSKFSGPGPKDVSRTIDRNSAEAKQRRAAEVAAMKNSRLQAKKKRQAAASRKSTRKAGEAVQEDLETIKVEDIPTDAAPVALDSSSSHSPSTDTIDPVPALDPTSHASPQSSQDPLATTPPPEAVLPQDVPPWYQQFVPTESWLPKDTRPEDWTPEACAHLEKKFWKNMGLGEASWYGADKEGSLFEDEKTPWNVARLPNLLNRMNRELPGVNVPYLYFGMWAAAFAWHVEDMDLFSINYIHFGAPKFWYAVPQQHSEKLERTIAGYFPQDRAGCDQFLRHKAFTVSPTLLGKDGVRVNYLVHHQNEFVITYPRGYHAGFNMGFNCAESVNFALESWLELGARAKACECVSHSVRIDVEELMRNEAKLANAIKEERQDQAKRKRKAEDMEEAVSNKTRIKIENESDDATESGQSGTPHARSLPFRDVDGPMTKIQLNADPKIKPVKRQKIVKIEQERPTFPCILCPSQSTEGLLPVWDPSAHVIPMGMSRDGVMRAHLACCRSLEEVDFYEDNVDGSPRLVAVDVNRISKDRWNLKCGSCKDKVLAKIGAKIQCTKGKCPRAYHVTCAIADWDIVYNVKEAEVLVPQPIPADAPEGTPPVYLPRRIPRTELLCPQHNADFIIRKKQKAAEELRDRILALLPGQPLRLRTTQGLLAAYLVGAREETRQVEVALGDGSHALFDWARIDFRPEPSVVVGRDNEYARQYVHSRKPEDPHLHDNMAVDRHSPPVPGYIAAQSPHTAQSYLAHSITASGQTTMTPPVQVVPLRKPSITLPSRDRVSISALLQPPPPRMMSVPNQVICCDSLPPQQHVQQYVHNWPQSHVPHPMLPYGPPSVMPMARSFQSDPVRYDQVTAISRSFAPAPHLRAIAYPQPYSANRPSSVPPSSLPQKWDNPPPFRSYSSPTSHTTTGPLTGAHPHNQGKTLNQMGTTETKGLPDRGVGKIDLGLTRMTALMACLPPLRVPAIHIAGTNGKGSVSAILESCLRQAGLRTARYNSPHLIEPRDAIRIGGTPPSQQAYEEAMHHVTQQSASRRIDATTFEIATAAAFLLINQSDADVMLIECGMGGAKDATNVIPNEIKLASALTSVGLDHTAFLGDTIAAITEEKSKIAPPNGLSFVAPQRYPDVNEVASRVAAGRNATTITALSSVRVEDLDSASPSLSPAVTSTLVKTTLPGFASDNMELVTKLNLPGDHQLDNLSLALTLLHTLSHDGRAKRIQPKLAQISPEALKRGVEATRWAGRCSWIQWKDSTGEDRSILVDGAHNSDSAASLRSYIDSLEPSSPVTFVLSLSESKGKSIESVLTPLLRSGDRLAVVDFTTPVQGMPWIKSVPQEAVKIAAQAIVGDSGVYVEDGMGPEAVQKALQWATRRLDGEEPGLVVVCGSLYLVADVYRLIGGYQ